MNYEDTSPLEILALQTLNLLTAVDIEPVFEKFLVHGLGDYEVACLASEPCKSLLDKRREIEAAFIEVFDDTRISKREALWVVFRLYLRRVLKARNREFEAMAPVIDLERMGYPALFLCPPKKYVAQEYGIEVLYGVYYAWDHEPTLVGGNEHNTEIRSAAEAAIKRYYSLDSELPEDLKRVQELIKDECCSES